MTDRHALWQIADQLQMDLRSAQAKLTELRAHLAQIDLPQPSAVTCPYCDLACKGPNTLAEHIYTSHDGPEPPHWRLGESRVRVQGQADGDQEPVVG